MFKITNSILSAAIIVFIFGHCSPKLNKFDQLLDGIDAKPEVLTLHRDSVRFKLEGAIPLQYLKSDIRILLYPEYSYGEGALSLSEIVAFDGMYTKVINEAKVESNFVFPYLAGMESGQLILKGIVIQKGSMRNIASKKIAEGLNTSPLLTRIGQLTPDEPIPSIGVYMKSDFSDPEVSVRVSNLLNEIHSLNDLSKDQLVYAGEIAKSLKEKEKIYLLLNETNKSELSLNNLGVVYLNHAQRELNLREKNLFISKAIVLFREANKLNPNSYSFHNLGQAYLLRGDYFEAYVAISEASSLERDESNEFLSFNEGLRGAIDIINGDYKLATIRLNRAPESEMNLFNKGLAYFLAEDYRNALGAFEECVQYNRDYGYGFYGLAMVASVSGDKQVVFEYLSKAVERSEYLRERSMTDLLFKKFREDPDFMEVYK